ncbi:MAG: winged helix-turn-helix domain-containing protein, partial [Stellaceae bacterium]
MEVADSEDVFQFCGFRFDRRGGGLFQRADNGCFAPVPIGPRALDVLDVLVERPGEVVARDEIIAAAWPGAVVEDNNLNMQIAALRRVLDEGRAAPSCIQTIPRRGYRFIAPVTRTRTPAQPELGAPPRAEDPSHSDRLAPTKSPPRPWVRRAIMAGVIGALMLAVAATIAWRAEPRWFAEIRPAPHLSLVVLPFANLGNDPTQQYFADGITEDLTTDLSRLADMRVVSRDTAFT